MTLDTHRRNSTEDGLLGCDNVAFCAWQCMLSAGDGQGRLSIMDDELGLDQYFAYLGAVIEQLHYLIWVGYFTFEVHQNSFSTIWRSVVTSDSG